MCLDGLQGVCSEQIGKQGHVVMREIASGTLCILFVLSAMAMDFLYLKNVLIKKCAAGTHYKHSNMLLENVLSVRTVVRAVEKRAPCSVPAEPDVRCHH